MARYRLWSIAVLLVRWWGRTRWHLWWTLRPGRRFGSN